MTKAELITRVARETGLSKAGAGRAINIFLAAISKSLKKEGRFALAGLGIFEAVKRGRRTARNPRTGEPVEIKAHRAVKFKAAKNLNEAVNP